MISSIQMTLCYSAIFLFLFSTIDALQPAPFRAGKFSNAAITTLAKSLGGEMGGHLEWFADSAELFTFPGHDGLPLQGYYIPAPVKGPKRAVGAIGDINLIAPEGPVKEVSLPVLIHCAGWSETTIKYSKFLRILNDQGYSIYSFDMRGQGFSSATGYDKGVVTHVSSFKEYVDDLEHFVREEVSSRARAARVKDGSSKVDNSFVYVANSMAALVGLTLQARSPTFDRLALVTPCIKPLGLTPISRNAIRLANKVGLGSNLLVRLPRDISALKITHDKENGKAWRDIRDLADSRLVVQGPSVSFMRELVKAASNIQKVGSTIKVGVLILQAGVEIFVENEAMGIFFSTLGSNSAKLVRFSTAYHEILLETPDIFDAAVDEILRFIAPNS